MKRAAISAGLVALVLHMFYAYHSSKVDPFFVLYGQTAGINTGTGSRPTNLPPPGWLPAPSTPGTNPIPVLDSLTPSSVRAGSSSLTITLAGSGFTSSSTVFVNGTPVATSFSSSGTLTAVLPAGMIHAPATLSITIVTPGPGGGISASRVFTVLAPAPMITAIIPAAGPPGASFVSKVTGTNLTGVSSVIIGGAGVTATVVSGSSTSLSMLVSIAPNAPLGTRPITITNIGGSVTFADKFSVRGNRPRQTLFPVQIIPEVESGDVRTGYVTITASSTSALPVVATVYGIVQRGVPLAQAAVPAAAITDRASVPIDAALGIAITNVAATQNRITFTLLDEEGVVIPPPITLTLQPNGQLTRFVSDLLPNTPSTGTLILQATAPFTAMGLRFAGSAFASIPVKSDEVDTGSGRVVIPQFAIGGGWATQITLAETIGVPISGRIDVFDSNGAPMPVKLNGETRSTFFYSLAPGAVVVFAPRDSNGRSPL